jgi:hypothetical protein
VIALAYDGGKLAMNIVLPGGTLLECGMPPLGLARRGHGQLATTHVAIALPKFHFGWGRTPQKD